MSDRMWRVSIFKDTSWGGWVTVAEVYSEDIAEDLSTEWSDKGYDTAVEEIKHER